MAYNESCKRCHKRFTYAVVGQTSPKPEQSGIYLGFGSVLGWVCTQCAMFLLQEAGVLPTPSAETAPKVTANDTGDEFSMDGITFKFT